MPSKNMKDYHVELRKFNSCFPCPVCKFMISPQNFESHCTIKHNLNSKNECVWCEGKFSWSKKNKSKYVSHLLDCFRKFVKSHGLKESSDEISSLHFSSPPRKQPSQPPVAPIPPPKPADIPPPIPAPKPADIPPPIPAPKPAAIPTPTQTPSSQPMILLQHETGKHQIATVTVAASSTAEKGTGAVTNLLLSSTQNPPLLFPRLTAVNPVPSSQSTATVASNAVESQNNRKVNAWFEPISMDQSQQFYVGNILMEKEKTDADIQILNTQIGLWQAERGQQQQEITSLKRKLLDTELDLIDKMTQLEDLESKFQKLHTENAQYREKIVSLKKQRKGYSSDFSLKQAKVEELYEKIINMNEAENSRLKDEMLKRSGRLTVEQIDQRLYLDY